MKRKSIILILILVFILILGGLLIRPFENGYKGQGECPVVIMGSTSGVCVGVLKSVDKTEHIQNEDFPNCTVTYSGNECKGIKLFVRSIAAN